MERKIAGLLLLFAGITLMLFSLLKVYFLLIGRERFLRIISVPGVYLDFSQVLTQEKIEPGQLEKFKSELISPELINQPLNFLANIIIWGFFLNAGFKFSSLGIQLIKSSVEKS